MLHLEIHIIKVISANDVCLAERASYDKKEDVYYGYSLIIIYFASCNVTEDL